MLTEAVESSAAGSVDAPAVAPQKHTGIAILGSHPATVGNAPFGDPSWLIYACSPDNTPFGASKRAGYLPRVDQWFEVHDPIEDPTRCFGYLKAVSEMPFVWMRDKRALSQGIFKGARAYPEEQLKGASTFQKVQRQNPDGSIVVQKVEIPNSDGLFCPYMFTSSIAYMLAKAISDIMGMLRAGEIVDPPEIGLWGIMQQSDNEYAYQRPGIQYFLYEAMKRGIKVKANRESCLFDMPQWKW